MDRSLEGAAFSPLSHVKLCVDDVVGSKATRARLNLFDQATRFLSLPLHPLELLHDEFADFLAQVVGHHCRIAIVHAIVDARHRHFFDQVGDALPRVRHPSRRLAGRRKRRHWIAADFRLNHRA